MLNRFYTSSYKYFRDYCCHREDPAKPNDHAVVVREERNGVDWIFQGSFYNLVLFCFSRITSLFLMLLTAKHGVYLACTTCTTLQTSLNQYQSLVLGNCFHFSQTRFPSALSVSSHLRCTTSYIFSFTPSFPGCRSSNLFNSSSN